MKARLSSQIYLIGNALLLFVLVLALFMMPKALALDPGDFSFDRSDEQLDLAVGLDPLGSSNAPALRIWWSSVMANPVESSGVSVTPTTVAVYDVTQGGSWGRRYHVTRKTEVKTPMAREILELLEDFEALPSDGAVCGWDAGTTTARGSYGGKIIEYGDTGFCYRNDPSSPMARVYELLDSIPELRAEAS